MIKPFVIEAPPVTTSTASSATKSSNPVGLDFSSLSNAPLILPSDPEPEKKKKGRPSTKKSNNITDKLFSSPAHMGEIITDTLTESPTARELSFVETNDPYESKYAETNAILRSAIAQIDTGLVEIQNDISEVRSAKTMRNKYVYLTNLQSSMGSFLSNKIAAARELNSTITKCNDLELRRYKEIRSNAANEQDDDQRIMEMYKAFVNVPANNPGFGSNAALGPTTLDMTMMSPNISGFDVGNTDMQYQSYLQNLTPAQNMMLLEGNPNIKQVVVYNQETGARYFEVMDLSTGEVIPNAEKHDAMFMEDVTIDQKNNVARNINIGETYPLVVVGKPILNEY